MLHAIHFPKNSAVGPHSSYSRYYILFRFSPPDLITPGVHVKWYSNAGLSNLVHLGDTFSPPLLTVGKHTYYVTQTVGGIESPSCPVNLTIDSLPSSPKASDTASCFGFVVPDLAAQGSAIRWYADRQLTALLHSGDTLSSGKTAIGFYTFYLTQTVNQCQSLPDSVTLAIDSIPNAPVSQDTASCFGFMVPQLIASGSNIRWYDDTLLATPIHLGDTLSSGKTAVGSYTFYATQTTKSCESQTNSIVLTIHGIPQAPLAIDTSYCSGVDSAILIAQGLSIQWYDNSTQIQALYSGDTLILLHPSVGQHTYYASQTVNGCESELDTAQLRIHPVPPSPQSMGASSCFGEPVPHLIANGSNLHWYASPQLTQVIHVGDTLITGKTAAGIYSYFVTQSLLGCASFPDSLALTIHAIPEAPITTDTSSCYQNSVPELFAQGSNVQWFIDTTLLSPIHQGNSFATGDTSVGRYVYYATQTVNGCESPEDSAILNIDSLPVVTVTPSWIQISSGDTILLQAFNADSYRWSPSHGLQDSTGAQIQANPDTNIIYTVIGTDGNGCRGQAQIQVDVWPLGDDEGMGRRKARIVVFPNPSRGSFTVEWPANDGDRAEISLINSLGSQLIQRNVWANNGIFQSHFEVKSIPNGAYYLLIDNGVDRQTIKIIIDQ
ncbi:T9SS type A sorting domain-containing protein [bacterium SCSIO 12741]|nr:T9SS type A sorting domain-containing protein [bacterium SCSIO 12741]